MSDSSSRPPKKIKTAVVDDGKRSQGGASAHLINRGVEGDQVFSVQFGRKGIRYSQLLSRFTIYPVNMGIIVLGTKAYAIGGDRYCSDSLTYPRTVLICDMSEGGGKPDPVDGSYPWVEGPPLIGPKPYPYLVGIGSKIYALRGQSIDTYEDEVDDMSTVFEVWDTEKDWSWSKLPGPSFIDLPEYIAYPQVVAHAVFDNSLWLRFKIVGEPWLYRFDLDNEKWSCLLPEDAPDDAVKILGYWWFRPPTLESSICYDSSFMYGTDTSVFYARRLSKILEERANWKRAEQAREDLIKEDKEEVMPHDEPDTYQRLVDLWDSMDDGNLVMPPYEPGTYQRLVDGWAKDLADVCMEGQTELDDLGKDPFVFRSENALFTDLFVCDSDDVVQGLDLNLRVPAAGVPYVYPPDTATKCLRVLIQIENSSSSGCALALVLWSFNIEKEEEGNDSKLVAKNVKREMFSVSKEFQNRNPYYLFSR